MISHLQKSQSPWELLKLNFRFWFLNYPKYFGVLVLSLFVGITPHFIPSINLHSPKDIVYIIEHYFIFITLYFLLALFFSGIVMIRIHDILIGHQRKFLELSKNALKNIPRIICFLILATFFITLGYFLFIIPGIIISVYCLFFVPLLFVEEKSLMAVTKEALWLTDNHLLYVFTVLFANVVIYNLIVFIIETLTLKVWVITFGNGQIFFGHNLFRLILNSIYFPFFVSYIFLLIYNLRLIQEKEQKLTDRLLEKN